jgi:hypothetical protein
VAANPYPALSRAKWRKSGHYVETVEHMVHLPGGLPRRSDLFGFVDLLAVPQNVGEPWVFVQVTGWTNVSTRRNKIRDESTGSGQWSMRMRELARRILDRGDRIVIEGWRKRDRRYEHKEIELTLLDVTDA